jgi:hypothetical protein
MVIVWLASKEHKTLFITDEEGIVTGIYKEK